jgi:phage host-nuclease inhibitor protein Gam
MSGPDQQAVDAYYAFKQYNDIADKIEKVEAELKVFKNELAYYEQACLDHLTQNSTGQDKFKVTVGGHTFYMYLTPRVRVRSDIEATKVARIFRSYKLGHMVKPTVNSNTLSAWYRAQIKEGLAVPKGIAKVLEIYEDFKLGRQKA